MKSDLSRERFARDHDGRNFSVKSFELRVAERCFEIRCSTPCIRTVASAFKASLATAANFHFDASPYSWDTSTEIITIRWLHDGRETHHGLLKLVKFILRAFSPRILHFH